MVGSVAALLKDRQLRLSCTSALAVIHTCGIFGMKLGEGSSASGHWSTLSHCAEPVPLGRVPGRLPPQRATNLLNLTLPQAPLPALVVHESPMVLKVRWTADAVAVAARCSVKERAQ